MSLVGFDKILVGFGCNLGKRLGKILVGFGLDCGKGWMVLQ